MNQGKEKNRLVPYTMRVLDCFELSYAICAQDSSVFLFESDPKRAYSDREIRKMLSKYIKEAGITLSIFPHNLRHFLFT